MSDQNKSKATGDDEATEEHQRISTTNLESNTRYSKTNYTPLKTETGFIKNQKMVTKSKQKVKIANLSKSLNNMKAKKILMGSVDYNLQ